MEGKAQNFITMTIHYKSEEICCVLVLGKCLCISPYFISSSRPCKRVTESTPSSALLEPPTCFYFSLSSWGLKDGSYPYNSSVYGSKLSKNSRDTYAVIIERLQLVEESHGFIILFARSSGLWTGPSGGRIYCWRGFLVL